MILIVYSYDMISKDFSHFSCHCELEVSRLTLANVELEVRGELSPGREASPSRDLRHVH